MLQAHSFLWNYFWVAPNAYLLILALLTWTRGLAPKIPVFLSFAVLSAAAEITTFTADVTPSISPEDYWRIVWANLIIVSLLKFLVIGEAFSHVFSPYTAVSRLGRKLVTAFGAALILLSGIAAGFAHGDSNFRVVAGAHLLEQTVFLVELGLIVAIFLLALYFRLSWDRVSFGVLLGLGVSACVHLATWAAIANASPSEYARTLFAFGNMATYHLCVLIWFYYLLIPGRVPIKSVALPAENHLALWNRELERLLQ
jgi:hypothetical protein